MIEVYTQVMRTKNYDLFKFIKGNRKIDTANLKQLVESMKEKQLIIPITVNENFEIIDGQHRYTACKQLGLPVYYISAHGYDIKDVVRANANGGKKWKDTDYLNEYCSHNDERYIKIKEIVGKYKISVNDFLKLLSIVNKKATTKTKKEFQEGKIDINGHERVIEFLEDLEDFSSFKFYKKSNFIAAFSKMYFQKNYDHEYMVKKLPNHIHNLTKQTSSHDYLSLLCNKIYSYGATKNPIYYSSDSRRFHK